MDEYLIGAGAILTAGPTATIRSATLHAQTKPALAQQVRAALIDFESANAEELSRVVLVAAGWSSSRFHNEVVAALIEQRECGLAEVLAALARAVGINEVHVFARWLPGADVSETLARFGISLICHPLEAIGQASLVSGQRVQKWRPPVRAA
jgi:hypothetical protein